jgi:hypothetical protein
VDGFRVAEIGRERYGKPKIFARSEDLWRLAKSFPSVSRASGGAATGARAGWSGQRSLLWSSVLSSLFVFAQD